MKDLKTALFEATYSAFWNYKKAVADCPEADWELLRSQFVILWQLIETAGLESEYYQAYGEH